MTGATTAMAPRIAACWSSEIGAPNATAADRIAVAAVTIAAVDRTGSCAAPGPGAGGVTVWVCGSTPEFEAGFGPGFGSDMEGPPHKSGVMSYRPGSVDRMLSKRDRIKVAQVSGTALRLVGDHADDALGEALHVQLDTGGGDLVDRAVALIHQISADPVVLNEAAAMMTAPPATPARCDALRLLAAAGADEGEARRIMAARGGGWSTPQAKAYGES